MTRDVTQIISEVPATVEALTGIDLMGAISGLAGIKSSESTDKEAAEAPKSEKSE
ncbi:MAG: hypothetical protein M5U34_48185 [Chloroflexi bacterium]|nr:hypothetical protein [Chloroflexota bacterium]